jgi:hypothetical protein
MDREENNAMFEYDDEAAVKFIHRALPEDMRDRFDEDTLYYILDTICDFFDSRDFLSDDDDEKEERELTQFIITQSKKDNVGDFTDDDIRIVLAAEAAYSDTLTVE